MNCAKHADKAVLGVCCSCGRTICETCNVAGVSGKLACSPQCAADIADHDAAIKLLLTKANRGSKTTGVFSIVAGTVFTLGGLYHVLFDPEAILIGLCLGVGATFLVAGVFYIRNAKTR